MVIDNLRSLNALVDRCRPFAFGGHERIEFPRLAVSNDDRKRIEMEATRLWQECGCSLGAVCSLFGFASYVIVLAGTTAADDWGLLRSIVGAAVFVFFTGTTGKLIGVHRSHRQLARLLWGLRDRIAGATNDGKGPACTRSIETAISRTLESAPSVRPREGFESRSLSWGSAQRQTSWQGIWTAISRYL